MAKPEKKKRAPRRKEVDAVVIDGPVEHDGETYLSRNDLLLLVAAEARLIGDTQRRQLITHQVEDEKRRSAEVIKSLQVQQRVIEQSINRRQEEYSRVRVAIEKRYSVDLNAYAYDDRTGRLKKLDDQPDKGV